MELRKCPTYVINLDRRQDRWQTFSMQPALKEFKALERFSAVDGSKLDVLNDKRISMHTRQNIKRKYRRSHYEICTAGAIGASLSHISIWKKFLESDSDYVVVFEDDTIVDDQKLATIDALIPKLPSSGWDMWLLGTHRWAFKGEPLIKGAPKGWWKVRDFTGAHAYVLSRKGAEILLEEEFPIETHIEYYICACAELKGLRVIKHWALRMTYFAEANEREDSDTFDGKKSCPLCAIPDYYQQHGFYMPYWKLTRMFVGGAALGFVAYGAYLGMKKKMRGGE